MRTLLTNVIGFSEMLADPALRLAEKTRLEYAEIVFASGLRIEHLIDNPSDDGFPRKPSD